ncbi:GerAB/ArcD/ProY family transporter [Clostridium ganghwense]|uniref:Endospore germination permease n=1 Tax=Clostridium ganghwense TaxID=312089 RepID=A0ABT4CM86_9CLOT|nr:endospore germination permease [Clostridium ganghwense]MCY6370159.1 endospore germination permease [Clostridium ganghwense]
MNSKITQRQYIAIILSSFIGVGIMSLASDVCEKAQQTGWISVFIGCLYPLILLLITSYIDNKMDHNDFWVIIKKLYGKYLGCIILLMFIINSFFFQADIIASYSNILKSSISTMFPHVIIVSTVVLLSIASTRKGLTIIGRLSEISLYFIIPMVFIPIVYLRRGDITNLQPYFNSSETVLSAVPKSLLAYNGAEISFFIIASIYNRKSTKKSAIVASLTVAVLYTCTVLMTIYYFGWELTSQLKFPLLFLFKQVRPPIFSDFTAIFMIIWSTTIMITLSIEQFFLCYSVSKLFNLNYKKSCDIVLPFLLIMSLIAAIYDTFRIKLVGIASPYLAGLVFIFALISFLLTFFRSRRKTNVNI